LPLQALSFGLTFSAVNFGLSLLGCFLNCKFCLFGFLFCYLFGFDGFAKFWRKAKIYKEYPENPVALAQG